MLTQAKLVTLVNRYPVQIDLSDIGIYAASPGDFPAETDCGASLAPKGTCHIAVAFSPSVLGKEIAQIVITDDAAKSPQSVKLSGVSPPSAPDAPFGQCHIPPRLLA